MMNQFVFVPDIPTRPLNKPIRPSSFLKHDRKKKTEKTKRGGLHWLRKKENRDGAELPVFLSANNLRPHISNSLMLALKQPVRFKTRQGAIANGIPAEIIPEICEVFLKAREAGDLVDKQRPIAQRAELITRALAQIGIVALIDKVTGFQYDRARNALTEILEKFISKELLKLGKDVPR